MLLVIRKVSNMLDEKLSQLGYLLCKRETSQNFVFSDYFTSSTIAIELLRLVV